MNDLHRYDGVGVWEEEPDDFDPEPAPETISPCANGAWKSAALKDTESAPVAESEESAADAEVSAEPDTSRVETPDASDKAMALPARFRRLYESRDGKLCLYEDEHGHLVAADASKFA